jgi:hypothetical protein
MFVCIIIYFLNIGNLFYLLWIYTYVDITSPISVRTLVLMLCINQCSNLLLFARIHIYVTSLYLSS